MRLFSLTELNKNNGLGNSLSVLFLVYLYLLKILCECSHKVHSLISFFFPVASKCPFLGLFQLGKITSKLPSFVADNFCCENAFSYLNAEIKKKIKKKIMLLEWCQSDPKGNRQDLVLRIRSTTHNTSLDIRSTQASYWPWAV